MLLYVVPHSLNMHTSYVSFVLLWKIWFTHHSLFNSPTPILIRLIGTTSLVDLILFFLLQQFELFVVRKFPLFNKWIINLALFHNSRWFDSRWNTQLIYKVKFVPTYLLWIDFIFSWCKTFSRNIQSFEKF